MQAQIQNRYEIRDPLHRAIQISASEREIVDSPFVQRLRDIRQLGFSHYPFPGATHTRFIHSLGVMHLAGRVFDAIFDDKPFVSELRRLSLRSCLRLAALLHDIGHGPFSHTAEFAMPNIHALGFTDKPDRRAAHEDYTVAILLNSELALLIEQNFPFTSRHVAALIDNHIDIYDDFFMLDGIDLRPILSQCISSNLDVDRLDYLMRDSYYTGVQYGKIDVDWLISHMARHVNHQGQMALALDRRALFAFDHFLVARYHMFLMVYFNRKSVAYEALLQDYMCSAECDYQIPADLTDYKTIDDSHLWQHLLKQKHPAAQRIVNRQPVKTVFEHEGSAAEVNLDIRCRVLEASGIKTYASRCIGTCFSSLKADQLPIYVLDSAAKDGHLDVPLSSMSSAFRYGTFEICLSRIFVDRSDLSKAQDILEQFHAYGEQLPLDKNI